MIGINKQKKFRGVETPLNDSNNNMLTIAQASDLHICQNGSFAYKVSDTLSALKDFVRSLKKIKVSVDLLCITGDLSDDGSISSYEIIKEHLSSLSIPYYLIPGNHDNKQNMALVFKELSYLNNYIDNRIFHSFILNNIKIILLDSVSVGNPYGSLTDGIIASLDKELDTNHNSIIFLHHPPFPSGFGIMDNPQFESKEKFFEVLNKSKNVNLVACGHIHRGIVSMISNVNFVVAPSTAMQLDLNLDNFEPIHFVLENAGYLIHRVSLTNIEPYKVITYMVQIPKNREMEIRYPFSE